MHRLLCFIWRHLGSSSQQRHTWRLVMRQWMGTEGKTEVVEIVRVKDFNRWGVCGISFFFRLQCTSPSWLLSCTVMTTVNLKCQHIPNIPSTEPDGTWRHHIFPQSVVPNKVSSGRCNNLQFAVLGMKSNLYFTSFVSSLEKHMGCDQMEQEDGPVVDQEGAIMIILLLRPPIAPEVVMAIQRWIHSSMGKSTVELLLRPSKWLKEWSWHARPAKYLPWGGAF